MDCRKVQRAVLSAALLLAVVLLFAPAAFAAQDMEQGDRAGEEKPDASAAQPGMCQACKSMMEHMKTMADLKQILRDARSAAEAAGDEKTVAKLDEALKLIGRQHKEMHAMMRQHMEEMHKEMMGDEAKAEGGPKCPMCDKSLMSETSEDKVVNVRCPITGDEIDPDNVPAELTREWNGKKIGFCCPACPPAWDKLSDEEKQKELDAVMAPAPKDDKADDHTKHHGD